MSSIIRADKWQNALGVAYNAVLQVVSTTKTDTFTTSSTSMVDVTGLSVSITPKFSSSKMLIMFNALGGNDTNNSVQYVNFVRDSTAIGQSTGGTTNNTIAVVNGDTNQSKFFSMHFLDSPATTSAVTYKIQMAVGSGSGSIGRRTVTDNRSISTITVMEIAQ